jgi:hypothetical protein
MHGCYEVLVSAGQAPVAALNAMAVGCLVS